MAEFETVEKVAPIYRDSQARLWVKLTDKAGKINPLAERRRIEGTETVAYFTLLNPTTTQTSVATRDA